ncbi:MAG: hypothetical protein RAP03_03650, partial [Candidatus Electryonea clarkiae]|nr:hypothetical protein [Candidatus Electryonea clarkiae]
MHSPIENIHNLLVHIRRLQKRSWAFAALVTGTTFVLLILTISSLVETFTWLSPAGRMPLVTGTLGIILLGSLAALTTLTVLLILKKFPDNKTIARTIWNRDSEIRDRILDAIELENLSNTNSSDSLRFAALELIDNESKKLDPHNYIRTGLFKKSIRTGAWVGAAIILILLVGGRAISDAAIRLINPNTVYLKPGTVLLSLDMPDTVTVIQGDSIMLSVLAFHHLPDEVTFFLDEGSGSIKTINAVSVTIENADNPVDSSRYVAQATNTQRNFSVYAQAGKAISNTAAVIVVPRPRIARLELTLFPPSYTKLEPLHLPEGVGDVRGLPGTHALVKLESSRPLKNAELVIAGMDSESSSIFLETEDRKASGRFLVKNNGNWWVNLVADDDVPGDEPLRWSIDLMEDYPPHVEVILPEDGAIIPESMTLPFVTVVDDDYGISKANLRFRVYNELLDPDSVGEEAFAIIPLRGKVSAPGRFEVRTLWGLSDLPLLPTEEVHYFVEAWDNDAWKGAKRVRSELRRVIFPSLDDLFALSREEEINVSEGIEEVMERAEDIRQKVEKTLERLKSNPEDLSWEESQSLQQSVNSQQELLEQLEKAAQTLEELKNAFEEHDMVNSELLEKYQKLQQLMEEISTPELRQAMEELSQAIQNQDGEKIRDALEQFAQDQENFIKSLDRSLAILEQLKAERRIEELASRAEDLAQREKELSDRLENDPSIDSEREALRQQQLENEFSSLMEEMKKAAEEFAKDYPELSDSLNNLSDEVEEDNL